MNLLECEFMEKDNNRIDIKDLLRPEAIELLNDITNYFTDYYLSKILICRKCEREINRPLQLILWHEDQEHYMSFHFKCALKPNSVDKFNELAQNFDFTYTRYKEKAYFL